MNFEHSQEVYAKTCSQENSCHVWCINPHLWSLLSRTIDQTSSCLSDCSVSYEICPLFLLNFFYLFILSLLYISVTWGKTHVKHYTWHDNTILTISTLQTKKDAIANSVDPDETARYQPSHQDLHCLLFCYLFLIETPICNNGCVQIQIPCQKLGGERVDHLYFSKYSADRSSSWINA